MSKSIFFFLFPFFVNFALAQIYTLDLVPNRNPNDVYVLAGRFLLIFFVESSLLVINFTLGGQEFRASLHSMLSELIVTDVTCGLVSKTCPRYCKDSRFY
jgi:hypothetical protein